MNTLYLDIFSGISGDMFIGALIDLGVDARRLEQEIARLGIGGYHVHVARKRKGAVEGVKFDVHLVDHDHRQPDGPAHHHLHSDLAEHPSQRHSHSHAHGHAHNHGHAHDHGHEQGHDHGHDHEHEHGHGHGHGHDHEHGRNYADIRALIERSALSDWVKQRSVAVFHRIALAEGKIHGHPPEEVHFHEVGAIDSIVDIVGVCVALEMLGRPRVLAAPVVEGTGFVECAHGRFPVPTAATLEILGNQGIALTQCDEPNELVTPTGAALLAEFVESFGPMRNLTARLVGYGLGTRENRTRPNFLRAVLGESDSAPAGGNDWETDTVAVLETNLDDVSAEVLGHFAERVLARGALDVHYTAVQMKKSRPGVLLTVLCPEAEADRFSEMILRETTAFGMRRTSASRRKLRREFVTVTTPHGEVTIKVGRLNGEVVQVAPEFECCRKLAEAAGVPLREVYRAALAGLPEVGRAVSLAPVLTLQRDFAERHHGAHGSTG